jgi:hypothetical protein
MVLAMSVGWRGCVSSSKPTSITDNLQGDTFEDQEDFHEVSAEKLLFCKNILGTIAAKIQYHWDLRPHGSLGAP